MRRQFDTATNGSLRGGRNAECGDATSEHVIVKTGAPLWGRSGQDIGVIKSGSARETLETFRAEFFCNRQTVE